MNKLLLFSLAILTLSNTYFTLDETSKDASTDETIVKEHVVKWADTIFYYYDNPRFEQFHAQYTEEYEISQLRIEMYESKLKNLEKLKAKGFYKKTDEEYEAEHAALVTKIADLKVAEENIEQKAEYYQILFWANIKTNQGLTVYYSLDVRLNDDFNVTSHEIKSEVGKKNDKTKILYASEVKK